MKQQGKIEIFSAGCPLCEEAVSLVQHLACPSCEVVVLDMNQRAVTKRAKRLGLRSLPAVVIGGQLADCCLHGFNAESLKAAGLGRAR